MKIGVVYPQTDIGSDPAAIRDFAQSAEALGYTHIVAYDHVLGANPERPGGWTGTYNYKSIFQEIFVLFSYMAAVTKKIGFLTGILILPQRQTALVAKQAATLDVLSGGRLRLGVGLGWNEIEYMSLNEDFHTRGQRMEEQVQLLRLLWTQPLVNFTGQWHTIPDAGINPLPVQRPIPIWFGGREDAAIRRAARIGDGWLPNIRNPHDAMPNIEKIHRFLEEAGRPPGSFNIESRIPYGDGNLDTLQATIKGWGELGVIDYSINTLGSGLNHPSEHLAAIRKFAESIGLKPQ